MNQIDWHQLTTLYRQKYLKNRLKEGAKSYQDANLGIPIFPNNLPET